MCRSSQKNIVFYFFPSLILDITGSSVPIIVVAKSSNMRLLSSEVLSARYSSVATELKITEWVSEAQMNFDSSLSFENIENEVGLCLPTPLLLSSKRRVSRAGGVEVFIYQDKLKPADLRREPRRNLHPSRELSSVFGWRKTRFWLAVEV